MKIYILDPIPEYLEPLTQRLEEALRQAGLKRTHLVPGDFSLLQRFEVEDAPFAIFLGPGCARSLERAVDRCRSVFPRTPLTAVVDNETYAAEAVKLRKLVDIRIMPFADIAQMAHFILDCEDESGASLGIRSKGVVTVAQCKGGVGGSTIAVALAACWVRNGLHCVIVDLDDLNPQISSWARFGSTQRKAVSEMLRDGSVPAYRLAETFQNVDGYDSRLVVVGQPESYQESFHFKADILEGAPSANEYVSSLLRNLQNEFEVVIIDSGRSWGIATFAALSMSQHVLFTVDDDGMSLRCSLDNLRRLARESDDPNEFDFSRWRVVMNAYSGRLLSPKDVSDEIEDLNIFPSTTHLHTVPFSESGRLWGGPGESFYDLADNTAKLAIEDLAFGLIPFRRGEPSGFNFTQQVKNLMGLF